MKNYFFIDGKKIPMSDETAKSILEVNKELNYEDVCKKLKLDRYAYAVSYNDDIITECPSGVGQFDGNEACSKEQLESLLALNKLINVAKYLNDEWKPDFNKNDGKVTIRAYSRQEDIQFIKSNWLCKFSNVYFKSEELARKAIDILGEDVIKKALNLNY